MPVFFSGGKDSTVLFHLVADVALQEKNVDSQYYSLTGKLSTSAQLHNILKMREMYRDVTETFTGGTP